MCDEMSNCLLGGKGAVTGPLQEGNATPGWLHYLTRRHQQTISAVLESPCIAGRGGGGDGRVCVCVDVIVCHPGHIESLWASPVLLITQQMLRMQLLGLAAELKLSEH